jgi:hypothetical protein
MSWDVLIQDLPEEALSVEHIPDDFEPRPLGTREQVTGSIREIFPGADFGDPAWGVFSTSEFSIEFNVGASSTCQSVMLHVRGGDQAAEAVNVMLHLLGRRAIDCSNNQLLPNADAVYSLREWREYLERILREA